MDDEETAADSIPEMTPRTTVCHQVGEQSVISPAGPHQNPSQPRNA